MVKKRNDRPLTEMERNAVNRRRRSVYQRRKSNGLCVRCGSPLDREGSYCAKCLEQAKADRKAQTSLLISLGICPICKKNAIMGVERSCPECRARLGEKAMTEENRQKAKERKRKRYDRLQEQGLCVMCGVEKADEGYKSCSKCREKRKRRTDRKEKPYTRNEWMSQCKCAICGKDELVPNKKVCYNCYAVRLKAIAKCHEKTGMGFNNKVYKNFKKINGKYVRIY